MWHGFGGYGMGGKRTDSAELTFSKRVEGLGIYIHDSPYRDYQAGLVASIIDKLPPSDGVFLWGTSLDCNELPVICSRTKHKIDGIFGFQASIYGPKGYPLNDNIRFAHLIYSYNPLPFPGLGAYKWPLGNMPKASYHLTPHHIPHPGDYDINDQNMFLAEMRRIMERTK